MKQKEIVLSFEEYDSIRELTNDDAHLLEEARNATAHAYAPYSAFHVGAAARLTNGLIVTGTNQENASFPVGICAERVLLSAVFSQYPDEIIDTIAVSYNNLKGESKNPVAPCGLCRQTLQESEQRYHRPIRLILGGMEGRVLVLPSASLLLPFAFTKAELEELVKHKASF